MTTRWTLEEKKVLDNFLDGERIVRLPARQKKRLVILRWLLEQFERGRRYPQAELNALIRPHHPDVAQIRREWFEFGMMDRKDDVYWRIDDA